MKVTITGGHGTMAQAIAKKLIQKGYAVYYPSRKDLDITKEEDIITYMKVTKPDILINCAGYIEPGSILKTSSDEWDKHFDINVRGAFLCAKYACLNGCKIVLNIGSTSAFEGRANWGAYSASKAALISLTESLVAEGIETYSLNPARTKTKMRKRLFPDEDENTLMNPDRVGEFVLKILNNEFEVGNHIVLKKDDFYIMKRK